MTLQNASLSKNTTGLWLNRERLFFCCIICFLVGCVGWLFVRTRGFTPMIDEVAIERMEDLQTGGGFTGAGGNGSELTGAKFNGEEVASADLLPEEVVELQVTALQAARLSPDELKVCFALAAPSNREITGPFENFAQMVSTSPYDRLINAASWQIGSTIVEGDFAAALVTTIDGDGKPDAFRFVLEKQKEEPYTNCWMTIGVQYVEVASFNSVPE